MPGMGNYSYAGTRWDKDISRIHGDTHKARSWPLKDEAYTADTQRHTQIQIRQSHTELFSLCSDTQHYASKQDELNPTPRSLSRLTITNERFFDFLGNLR